MEHDKSSQVRVRLYGHEYPDKVRWNEKIADFITTGGMHLSGGPRDLQHEDREPKGAAFYVCPISYEGLCNNFPRAHYQHLIIMHNFDWNTRRGEYIHIPYGGAIEITAI